MATNRREFVRLFGASLITASTAGIACGTSASQSDTGSDLVTEDQRGDPDTSDEFIRFSPSAIQQIVIRPGKATFEEWDETLPLAMITAARKFLGFSRKTNPQQIAKFLELFHLPFATDRGPVPFCAAGLSYCALSAYSANLNGVSSGSSLESFRRLMPDLEHYYFYPTVSCVDMYHIAAGKRRWVAYDPKASHLPKPGWLVLYDWKKSGIPDHCGLVQQSTKDTLVTIEFNTSSGEGSQRNGGTVAERTRLYDYIYGFVITDSKS